MHRLAIQNIQHTSNFYTIDFTILNHIAIFADKNTKIPHILNLLFILPTSVFGD